ncbi:MAG: RNA polymerase sigma factor [Granulosicoccus sp.]
MKFFARAAIKRVSRSLFAVSIGKSAKNKQTPIIVFSPRNKLSVESLIQAGYRYACALQKDPGEAQGLVHEAWLRVSRAQSTPPDKALLFRCVRNVYIDQYRRSKRVRFSAVDDLGRNAGDQTGSFDVAEVPDAQLQSALDQLRDTEREALFLSVVEGYTANEIATLTGSSRGTVLSLIHRARLKLKNLMQEDNVTPFKQDLGRGRS